MNTWLIAHRKRIAIALCAAAFIAGSYYRQSQLRAHARQQAELDRQAMIEWIQKVQADREH